MFRFVVGLRVLLAGSAERCVLFVVRRRRAGGTVRALFPMISATLVVLNACGGDDSDLTAQVATLQTQVAVHTATNVPLATSTPTSEPTATPTQPPPTPTARVVNIQPTPVPKPETCDKIVGAGVIKVLPRKVGDKAPLKLTIRTPAGMTYEVQTGPACTIEDAVTGYCEADPGFNIGSPWPRGCGT